MAFQYLIDQQRHISLMWGVFVRFSFLANPKSEVGSSDTFNEKSTTLTCVKEISRSAVPFDPDHMS